MVLMLMMIVCAARPTAALRQFLPAHGGGCLRYRQHDILGTGVRAVLRGGERYKVPQCAAGANPCHQNGLHLHPDVLHLPQQRADEGVAAPGVGTVRPHAHDRHQPLRVAQRPGPGNQA